MHHRIGGPTKASMLFVAAVIDATQLVITLLGSILFFIGPVLSSFISIFAALTFYLWFALRGVSFIKGSRATRKAGWFFTIFFLENIPFVGGLLFFGWTLSVWKTIEASRAEDAERA